MSRQNHPLLKDADEVFMARKAKKISDEAAYRWMKNTFVSFYVEDNPDPEAAYLCDCIFWYSMILFLPDIRDRNMKKRIL